MRLPCSNTRTRPGRRAFTLIEVLVAMTTLVIIIGAVIACNLYGLAMADRQEIWMGASSDAASAVSTLMSDIRAANTLYVGTYQTNVFTAVSNNVQQSGNALEIFPTTNSTPVTIYYYDSVSNNLDRTNYYGAGQPGDFKLVSANPITNDNTHLIFTEVNYANVPLSNSVTVAPISIYLSFTRLQNPQIVIENGSLVDLYQIITTVTPRL
jgi:type II secretory pathway pseudopilin PulG